MRFGDQRYERIFRLVDEDLRRRVEEKGVYRGAVEVADLFEESFEDVLSDQEEEKGNRVVRWFGRKRPFRCIRRRKLEKERQRMRETFLSRLYIDYLPDNDPRGWGGYKGLLEGAVKFKYLAPEIAKFKHETTWVTMNRIHVKSNEEAVSRFKEEIVHSLSALGGEEARDYLKLAADLAEGEEELENYFLAAAFSDGPI